MGFLRLTRPANVVTAVSDILAGVAISGYFLHVVQPVQDWKPLVLLIVSTIGLYAGGVVFNDVFDAKLDAVERPERPIPSGVITGAAAATGGALLLLMGIVAAANVHADPYSISTVLSVAIAVCALLYDKWGKHHFIAGPLMMGLCRGLNLLLGVSIIPGAVAGYWFLAWIPIVYIAAITMISRGEVHGSNKTNLYFALGLYVLVLIALLIFSMIQEHWQSAFFFLAGFGIMIIRPLVKAMRHPSGALTGKAVKAGVLALILMNATWAAASGQLYLACLILSLLPVSLLLARLFAVT